MLLRPRRASELASRGYRARIESPSLWPYSLQQQAISSSSSASSSLEAVSSYRSASETPWRTRPSRRISKRGRSLPIRSSPCLTTWGANRGGRAAWGRLGSNGREGMAALRAGEPPPLPIEESHLVAAYRPSVGTVLSTGAEQPPHADVSGDRGDLPGAPLVDSRRPIQGRSSRPLRPDHPVDRPRCLRSIPGLSLAHRGRRGVRGALCPGGVSRRKLRSRRRSAVRPVRCDPQPKPPAAASRGHSGPRLRVLGGPVGPAPFPRLAVDDLPGRPYSVSSFTCHGFQPF